MLTELMKLLKGYDVVSVTKENYTDLADVYLTNQDFFLIEEGLTKEGQPACTEDIWTLAVNKPADLDPKDKFCVGIWKDKKPVAILDYLVGSPPNVAYLSLLIVHRDYKRQSIGTEVTKAFIDAARLCGYGKVMLGVDENNKVAVTFWEKFGFVVYSKDDDSAYYELDLATKNN